MKKHPGYSAALLEPSMVLDPIRHLGALASRADGWAWVIRMACLVNKFRLGARIVAIADAFVSMISGRKYRDPMRKR